MSAYALHFAQQDVATANQDMLKSGIAIRHPNKNGSGSLEHTSCSSEGSDDSDQLLSLEDLDDEIEDLPDIVDEDLSFSTAKSSDTTDGGDLDETCEGPCASDPPVSPPSSMQTASDNVTTQQAPAPAECHDTPARKPLRGILRKTSNNSTKDNRCDKTPAQRRSLFPGINVFRCNVGTRRRNRLGPKDSDTDDESTQDLPDSPSSSEDSSSDASSDYDHLDRAGLLKPTSVHSSPKSVSFYPRARILPVPHRLDLIARASVSPSTAEVGDSIMATSGHDALWWSRSDYEHFRHTARILARTLIPHERDRDARSYLTCCRSSVTATSYLHNVWQDEHGDKWWCKFGHSRRGLEHITQIGVGRERQRALVESVSAVLEEQDQMLEANDGEGKVDRRRLARVSRMYTKHAREAAARSGIEDAKIAMAIRSGFSTKKLTPPTPPQSPVHIVKKPVCKNSLLDANTGTALRRRERALSYPLEEEKNDVEDATPRRRRQSIAEPTDKFKKISSIARRATAFGQRREDQEYVEKKRLPSLEELRSMLQQNLTNQ